MAKSEILKPFILSWEGGFACVKGDRGGATNRGVTIATFRSVFGKERTVDDLKKMSDEQWQTIFKRLFWDRWKADGIECQAIANLLVDWVWASGVYGVRIPQKVLGVKIDGAVGPKTLAAINGHPDKKMLFDKLLKEREDYFRRIGVREQKKFLNGWLNRNSAIHYDYLKCNGGKIIRF